MNRLLSAELILTSKSGLRLDKTEVAITQENIEDYRPSEVHLQKVVSQFQSYGFEVTKGDITVSITGDQSLFEKTFDAAITIISNQGQISKVSWTESPKIPDSVKDSVLDIVFPEPPEFFN